VGPSGFGRDWSPVSSNKSRGCCCRTPARRPLSPSHCSRGVQPGGIYAYVVHREPPPGGPGSGLRRGRRRFLYQLPLWFYIAAEACSPAVIACMSVHREPPPGGPGSGLRRGRRRFLCQLPLWLYIYILVCRRNTHKPLFCDNTGPVWNNRSRSIRCREYAAA
jgi:hypothetical protein